MTDPAGTGDAADQLTATDVDALCHRAVQLTNRDRLLEAMAGRTSNDLFAKAREYAAVVGRAHRACEIPFGVPLEGPPGPTVSLFSGGERRLFVMFASNDYLNLSTDARVHEAVRQTLGTFGVGAGSSRVNAGYSTLHRLLEERLAGAVGKPAALILPTGYDAVVAAPQSLLTSSDRAVVDASSHACILEGAHSSGATVRMFSHNDARSLDQTLTRCRERAPDAGVLVIVEGAYSMDGDIAPLPDLVAVCRSHGARLLVDEAHAFGVHGPRGGGVTEHFNLADSVDLIAGTFSKSLGSVGGFVAGDADVITYMRYMCRRSVFSATTPAALVAGVLAALDIMQTDHARRTRLWQNVRYLREGLIRAGARVLGDGTASVPVHIGADGLIFRFTEDLMRAGVFTFPAVYPTVPRGHSLFRLAVQSAHETSHLDRAIDVFGDLLRKYDVHAH